MSDAKKPMTPKQAADILVKHNKWRRLDEDCTQNPSPGDVGLAIDIAVAFINRKSPRRMTPVCPKCGSNKRYYSRDFTWYECRACETRYAKDGKVVK
jgi:hypothetical protein